MIPRFLLISPHQPKTSNNPIKSRKKIPQESRNKSREKYASDDLNLQHKNYTKKHKINNHLFACTEKFKCL
jgi:hypothetical protein